MEIKINVIVNEMQINFSDELNRDECRVMQHEKIRLSPNETDNCTKWM